MTALFVVVAILLIVVLTSRLQINAFFALILVALGLALVALPFKDVVTTLKGGFGGTLASIGLIILFGTTIGVLLDKTRATHAMAAWVIGRTGKQRAPRAMAITGVLAGLPIFCDSGFIVLSGLNRSMARESGVPMARMAATLAICLYAMHCLVPPHPGITAAAGILGGSLGELILLGTAIALPTAVAGYAWVKWRSGHLPPEMGGTGEAQAQSDSEDAPLPSPRASFLPVIVPLALITVAAFLALSKDLLSAEAMTLVKLLGDPVCALLIGVVLCLPLLGRKERSHLNDYLAEAVEKAGPILIITAAGGAFGAVIKATGMGESFSRLLGSSQLGLLVPFLLAAVLKTAQGSSTVAAITTSSIIAPMLPALGLDSHWGRLLALCAIGSGSMVLSHANDSYFWVIAKFSEISPKTTLRVYSTATIVSAVVSFAITWLLALALVR